MSSNVADWLRNRAPWIVGALGVVVLGLTVWDKLQVRPPAPEPTPETVEETPSAPALVLTSATFSDLPGWPGEGVNKALEAFNISCAAMMRRGDSRSAGPNGQFGTIGDWRPACEAARQTAPENAQALFEKYFVPHLASNNGEATGLFTGYFEPELTGSRTPSDIFHTPLRARPDDLVEVNLGAFRDSLKGERIAGRVENGRLVPYAERSEIVANESTAEPLVHVDDAVDAFFLQIQGSGRVVLDDGSVMRVGYAGTNGQPYFAIGRELIARGYLTRQNVSLQSIRQWLDENPDQADEVMNLNRSYVFFRELTGPGPLGSQGVALTPDHSLAVDRRFHAMGTPVWLDTTNPLEDNAPFQKLFVAQDTGGAIRGPVRGDVFFGPGAKAEAMAGHMKQDGRFWVFLPMGL